MFKKLSSVLDLEQLTQNIMEAAKELWSADRCTLYIVDSEKKELWSKIPGKTGTTEIRFPMHMGIAGHVASNLRSLGQVSFTVNALQTVAW